MTSISVSFPFQRTTEGGVFKATRTTEEAVRSKLVSLMTTKRGHRIMRPDLYSPLFDFIMEQWDDFTRDDLVDQVEEKLVRYMPEISVKDISAELQDDGATLKVNIIYTILDLGGSQDDVTFFVPIENE